MEEEEGQRKRTTRSTRRQSTAAGGRCTRSQAAPEWTTEETLVLVSEIAALDVDWLKAFSSYQRWKMISENCISITRSSNQCKKRWEALVSDYRKIRAWESTTSSAAGSYWSLHPAKRRQLRLPESFDRVVFDSVEAVVSEQEGCDTDSGEFDGLSEEAVDDGSGGSGDTSEADASGSDEGKGHAEEIIGMLDAEMAAADADSESEDMGAKTVKSKIKELEMTNKLHKNAEEIHAILRGELPENASQVCASLDLSKPNAAEIEFVKRQADELIKAFGVLNATLDQFAALIKDGTCEGVSLMN